MFYIPRKKFFFAKMSESLISTFLVSNVSESRRSLTKNERCELIAQVAYQKWATMSNLLTSLRGNERSWANPSGPSPKMSEWVKRSFFSANCSFAHFWAKNERFARKSDERIPWKKQIYCLPSTQKKIILTDFLDILGDYFMSVCMYIRFFRFFSSNRRFEFVKLSKDHI